MSTTMNDSVRNGVDTAALFATIDAVKADPALAAFQFRATNRWVSGTHNQSTIDGFYGAKQEMTHREVGTYDADHPAVLVGEDHGPTPVEFLLHALAACLTSGSGQHRRRPGREPDRGHHDRGGRHGPAGDPRPVRLGAQRLRADQGHGRPAGDDPEKLRGVVEQSRQRSAVYDILTNGVPVTIAVDAVMRYDVVVVGARAAGAATAHLLARAGVRVLLVDRANHGADTMSTHALMRGGVLQLQRWGLLDRIVAAGTPAVRRVTFRYAGQVLPIAVKPSHGVDALYAPRRTVLDPILVDAAAAAGAEVRFGVPSPTSSGTGPVRSPVSTAATATGARSRRRRGWSSAPTGSARPWRELRRRRHRAGRHRCQRVHVRLLARPRRRRVRVELPPRRGLGRHPHQRRDGLRVRQRHPAAHRPRRPAAPASRSSARAIPTSPPGSPSAPRRRCGRSPGCAATCAARGVPAGRSSATPATTRTRSAPTGSPTPCATPSSWPAPSSTCWPAAPTSPTPWPAYQAARDALSGELFDAIDVIAGHGWTDDEIGGLLLRMNAAMGDEVDALAQLPPLATSAA